MDSLNLSTRGADGTQGDWLSNPPMNRWAIFYRPAGLRSNIGGRSLASRESSKRAMPSRRFRATVSSHERCGHDQAAQGGGYSWRRPAAFRWTTKSRLT